VTNTLICPRTASNAVFHKNERTDRNFIPSCIIVLRWHLVKLYSLTHLVVVTIIFYQANSFCAPTTCFRFTFSRCLLAFIRMLNFPHNWNKTETKLKQNSSKTTTTSRTRYRPARRLRFKTVLSEFSFTFSGGFRRGAEPAPPPPPWTTDWRSNSRSCQLMLNFDCSAVKHGTQHIRNYCHQTWLSDSFRVQQICFRPGLLPNPTGGAYSALIGLRGPYF